MCKKYDMFCDLDKRKTYSKGKCGDWIPDGIIEGKHNCLNCFHSSKLKKHT